MLDHALATDASVLVAYPNFDIFSFLQCVHLCACVYVQACVHACVWVALRTSVRAGTRACGC